MEHWGVAAWLLLCCAVLVDGESKSMSPEAKTTDDVMVVDSGLFSVEIDSVALIFYVTAINKGVQDYNVKPMVDKCCLRLDQDANEFDCESMTLSLETPVLMRPGEKHNFTLVFANLYVTDRIGECVIQLEYMEDFQVQHTLKFDTVLPSSPRYCSWVPPTLRAYLFGVTVRNCKTVDEDRVRNCEPANCVLKYNGHRNYYNPKTKECEKVPNCSKVNGAGLPSQAYVPHKNKCVNLDSTLLKEDFDHFTEAAAAANEINGIEQEEFTRQMSDTRVRCVHGIIADSRCICSEGWRSRYMDPAAVPMEEMMQLCDVPTEGYHIQFWGLDWDVRTDLIMTLLGALMTLTLTLTCLSTYEYYLHRGGVHEKEELGNLKKEITSTSADFAAGDDEINANEDAFDRFAYNQGLNASKAATTNDKDSSKYIKGYAVALMNHFTTKETELSLRVGDVINDLRRTGKDGMLEGTCHGVVGLFPDFCVNIHESRKSSL